MNLWQFIWEGLKIALGAIRANRQRSLLTMLGVGTGILAITGILTMVNSLQTSITDNLSALGNTTLFVHHWPWKDNSQDWYKYFNRPKVSYEDYLYVQQRLKQAKAVSFTASVRGQSVQAGARSVTNLTVTGGTAGMEETINFEVVAGRFFSPLDYHLGGNVALIGANIASQLFPAGQGVGEPIRIGSKRLRVIGVLKKEGSGGMFGDMSNDDKVFVPFKVMANMYNLNQRSVDKVMGIRALSYEDVPYVESELTGLMRASRGLRPTAEDNFAINKQEALMQQFDQVFGSLKMGGWVISLFSLLIGGFSIGNIMYISVRERTKEIGVQKALGATKGFVLYQFVSEAVLLCLAGGILGVLSVVGIGLLVQAGLSQTGVPLEVAIAPGDIGIGLGLSVLIGLVSGIVPASMAASLDPVIAIRSA